MSNNIKILIVTIGVIVATFFVGRFSKKPVEIIHIEERIVEKIVEKVIEVQQNKQQQKKMVTVRKEPDGTVETTTVDTITGIITNQKEKETSKEVETSKISHTEKHAGYRAKYSIGVYKGLLPDVSAGSYRVDVGYRIIGNFWLSSGFDTKDRSVDVGVRIDF